MKAFKDALKEFPDVKLLASKSADYARTPAVDVMKSFLRLYPQLDRRLSRPVRARARSGPIGISRRSSRSRSAIPAHSIVYHLVNVFGHKTRSQARRHTTLFCRVLSNWVAKMVAETVLSALVTNARRSDEKPRR